VVLLHLPLVVVANNVLSALRLAIILIVLAGEAGVLPASLAASVDNTPRPSQANSPGNKNASDKTLSADEMLELGEFHFFNGNPSAAIKAFNQAIAVNPDLLQAHMDLANLYSQQGNLAGAIEHYREALRIKPKQKGIYLLLGQLLSAQGDPAGAVNAYEQESQLTNKSPAVESALAYALVSKGDYKQAVEHFEELTKKQPHNFDLCLGLAMALAKDGKQQEALAELDSVLKQKPNLAEAHNLRGDIYCLGNEKDKAIEAYKQSIAIDEKFAQGYLSLGNLYLEEKDFTSARDIFSTAVQKAPPNRDIFYGLGFAQEKLGSIKASMEAFEKALKLETDPKQAETIREHLAELSSGR
jgi:tetratricopeptide (TPR) repeat protein